MKKNTSTLAKVVKKPGNYIVDMEELKSNIQENSAQEGKKLEVNVAENAKKTTPVKKEQKKEEELYSKFVGLHVPISIALRNKLKIKAISEGKKMKDFIVELIEKNVD